MHQIDYPPVWQALERIRGLSPDAENQLWPLCASAPRATSAANCMRPEGGGRAIKKINREMLAEAVDRIVQAVNPEQILLFGSQAWGQPTQDSDIDLLIILNASNQPGYTRAREVYRSLRGIPLPIEVVVRTRDEVTRAANVISSLEHQALKRGQVLYG